MQYADPELLISTWLGAQTGKKTWADPVLPSTWTFAAPIGHVQRGAGEGDTVLTLDSVLLDIDWIAKVADHARECAEQTRALMRLTLPLTTFEGGPFVTGVQTVMAPCWTPATGVYRRSATYRVWLHGIVG
jgi:hypothetical protein